MSLLNTATLEGNEVGLLLHVTPGFARLLLNYTVNLIFCQYVLKQQSSVHVTLITLGRHRLLSHAARS